MPTLPDYQMAALFKIIPGNHTPIQKASADARQFLRMRSILTDRAGYVGQLFPTAKAYDYRAELIKEHGLEALLPLAPNPLMAVPLILEAEGYRPSFNDEFTGRRITEGYDMSGSSLSDGYVRLSWKFPNAWMAVGDPDRRETSELYGRQCKPLNRFAVLLTKHGWRVEARDVAQIGREYLIATPPAQP